MFIYPYIWRNETKDMRYLHYIIRLEDNKQIEADYSNSEKPSWTKELYCKESNGKLTYKIWDKETNKVNTVI